MHRFLGPKDELRLETAAKNSREGRETIWSQRDFVLAAVKEKGAALQHASTDLRADREVVRAAVAKSGCALECASEGLRADREVVLVAAREGKD